MSNRLCLMWAALSLCAALLAAPQRPCRAELGEPAPAEKRIAEELNAPTELEFIETPLEDVIATLKDFHRIQIQIDQRALYDVGVPKDCPISKSLKGTSLRSALALMLRDLDLTCVVRDEVLLITTPEEAENYVYVRVYPVDDLIGKPGVAGSRKRDCDSLIEVIMTCILPESWEDVGGPGSISAIPPGAPKALAVSQHQQVHGEIAEFLRVVRGAVRAQASGDLPPAEGSRLPARAERRIAEELKAPTQLEFIGTPLPDVVDSLKNMHKIEIQIDQRALEDVGVPSDSPITMNLKGLSLASALRLMLRELELTCVIRDEVLLITTPEEAENMLVTVAYPLNDLVVGRREPLRNGVKDRSKRWASSQGSQDAGAQAPGSPSGSGVLSQEVFTYPDLIKSITNVIAPESWDQVGGHGDLSVLSLGTFEALVVMQTQDVHEQIAALLARPEFRQPSPPAPSTVPQRRLPRFWRR